jgi:hypothetical protein
MPVERIAFTTEQTDDRQTLSMQATSRRVADAVNAHGAAPLITDELTFTAGEVKTINHGLGRQPTEWGATDVVTGYGSFRRTGWNTKTITIQSENACTARFKVA